MLVADGTTAASAERFTVRTVRSGTALAVAAARAADVVVLAVGNDPHLLGREAEDRPHLRLPESQAELGRAVLEANASTVVVVVSSYPYVLGTLGDQAAAVVWSSHGGQELGHGLADVLTGAAEPYGRLAQAWPASEDDAGGLLDYDVIGGGLTSWYARRPARWAFGHGLSYTTVEYDELSRTDGGVRVTVRNTGSRPVDELVQVYAAAPEHRLPVPHRRLVAHRRVALAPGGSAVVELPVPSDAFAVWDVTRGRFVVEPGRYELHAGRSSADLPLVLSVDVGGDAVPPRAAPRRLDLGGRPRRARRRDVHGPDEGGRGGGRGLARAPVRAGRVPRRRPRRGRPAGADRGGRRERGASSVGTTARVGGGAGGLDDDWSTVEVPVEPAGVADLRVGCSAGSGWPAARARELRPRRPRAGRGPAAGRRRSRRGPARPAARAPRSRRPRTSAGVVAAASTASSSGTPAATTWRTTSSRCATPPAIAPVSSAIRATPPATVTSLGPSR